MFDNFELKLKSQENEDLKLKKEAIYQLLSQLYKQMHIKKQLIIFRILNKLIQSKHVESKFVCDSILLNLMNNSPIETYVWCKSLEYICKFISTLDYKSCREIFKTLLELIKSLSQQLSNHSSLPDVSANPLVSTNSKIETLYEVFNFSWNILALSKLTA